MSYLSYLVARAFTGRSAGAPAGAIRPRLAPYFAPEFDVWAETLSAPDGASLLPREETALQLNQVARAVQPALVSENRGRQPERDATVQADALTLQGGRASEMSPVQEARPDQKQAEPLRAEFDTRRSEALPLARVGALHVHAPEVRRFAPEQQAQAAPSVLLAGSRQENSPGSSSDAGAPAVHVHIGRVDVRVLPVVAQSTAPPVAAHRRPTEDMSLEEYLRGAKGGGR